MGFNINVDQGRWKQVGTAFNDLTAKLIDSQADVCDDAAQEFIQEATRQINNLVYDAALPTSAQTDPHYLDHARTGATRRAIQVTGSGRSRAMFYAGVGVNFDIANRKGFPYPIVLDMGAHAIRYAPRPFWRAAVAVMRQRYILNARAKLADAMKI